MTPLRWFVAAFLVAHGIAHTLGFAVAWRLTTTPDVPHHTALLSGRCDVGDGGMRVIGLLWMFAGLAFAISGVLVATKQPLATAAVASAAVLSLILCAVEWPYSRIGLYLDIGTVAALPMFHRLV